MSAKGQILGIDVGGTGIKGAIVDIASGKLVSDRLSRGTPQPATPEAIAKTIGLLVQDLEWTGTIGCGFPAVIIGGRAYSAANIDPSCMGPDLEGLFSAAADCKFHLLNDADAAGIAEMKFGAGAGEMGSVMILTAGTGIGSAFFVNGELAMNTELGHLEFKGMDAELYAAASARTRENLSWEEWGIRFNEYLTHIEFLFHPNLIILGGGASKRFELFKDQFALSTRIVPAQMQNDAGIIGAALYAKTK